MTLDPIHAWSIGAPVGFLLGFWGVLVAIASWRDRRRLAIVRRAEAMGLCVTADEVPESIRDHPPTSYCCGLFAHDGKHNTPQGANFCAWMRHLQREEVS